MQVESGVQKKAQNGVRLGFRSSSHFILSQLVSKSGIVCLAVLVSQQVIVASSTLILSELIQRVEQGQPFTATLFGYLASLLLPYLPGAVALFLLVRWKVEALRSLIHPYLSAAFGKTAFWQDRSSASMKDAAFSGELKAASEGVVDYLYNLASMALNVGLNILAVSYVIGGEILVGYVLSVAVAGAILKFQWRTHARLSSGWLKSQIELRETMLSMSNNLFLGNRYHYSNWTTQLFGRLESYLKNHRKSEGFSQLVSISVSLVTGVPCLALVAYGMIRNQGDVAALAVYVVTLPRLFVILGYTHGFLHACFQWALHTGQLNELFEALQSGKTELGAHSPEEIRVNGQSLAEYDLVGIPSGRYTVTGGNGSGKTTFLLKLKERHGAEALYLPPHDVLQYSSGFEGLSTGQAQIRKMSEVLRNSSAGVLLLDEWDANLDEANRSLVSSWIDEWIVRREGVVYEIRHRGADAIRENAPLKEVLSLRG